MIQLRKAIQAHGNEVTEITFREPNGGDVAACGFPFRFTVNDDGTQTVTPEANAITGLIARLGNVPLSAAKALTFDDWMACMGEVFGFFGQSIPKASSNGASTSHGSGNGTLESH
jgi:hypothetical protein